MIDLGAGWWAPQKNTIRVCHSSTQKAKIGLIGLTWNPSETQSKLKASVGIQCETLPLKKK